MSPAIAALRPDLAVIARHIPAGARVLDIGCGDGSLMAVLRDQRGVDARGLSVMQGDADRDLADYPNDAFDYAILSQTLQTAKRPDWMLDQLLRVGRQAFVSFPNFAYWRMRVSLMLHGKMPVMRHLPVSWYATENIHHVTVADFEVLLKDRGVKVEKSWFFAADREVGAGGANWRAEYAVFQLSR